MNKLFFPVTPLVCLCLLVGSSLLKAEDLTSEQAEFKPASESKEKVAAKRIKGIYNEAVSLYAKKRYPEALSRFLSVEAIQPGYKQTAFYLEAIPQTIKKNQAMEKTAKADKKELARLYKKAVRLYRQKIFEQSLETFVLIRTHHPGYGRSDEYIKKINAILSKPAEEKPSVETINVDILYKDAVTLYKRKQYEESLFMFNHLDKQAPNYKNSQSYIKKISGIMQKNIEVLSGQLQEKRNKKIRHKLIEMEKKKSKDSYRKE